MRGDADCARTTDISGTGRSVDVRRLKPRKQQGNEDAGHRNPLRKRLSFGLASVYQGLQSQGKISPTIAQPVSDNRVTGDQTGIETLPTIPG